MGELQNHARYGTREYWRARADETRAIADGFTDPDTRRQMIAIAAWYEQMAEKTPAEQPPAKKPGLAG